jgi:hypothetical protein
LTSVGTELYVDASVSVEHACAGVFSLFEVDELTSYSNHLLKIKS